MTFLRKLFRVLNFFNEDGMQKKRGEQRAWRAHLFFHPLARSFAAAEISTPLIFR
jgi:hypothetical protein